MAWARTFPLLFALYALSAHAELPAPVAAALRQAGIPDSHVGIVVQDLDRPEPILLHGGDRSFNPASVIKLVTTLAALDRFGPAYSFQTRVLLDGALHDGILDGNLILQGGGDPGLTEERLWLLLRELRARGVREIHGDVLLDGGYYALDPIDPGAFDQAPLRPYNAPPAALLVNFNTVLLRLVSDGATVSARLEPEVAAPLLDNHFHPSIGACSSVRDQMVLDAGKLTLSGYYPSACGDQSIALDLLPPNSTTAAWFRALWRELGGTLSGTIRPGAAPENARLLLEFDSPPLSQLVRDTNKYSNNVMAKMLLLNLGAARYGAPATWDKGVRALRDWLQEHDLECDKLVLENGAGLSRIERTTAWFLARLLRWASRQPIWFEYAASLPAVGLEGTQKRRLNGTEVQGQAWLKSGSLEGVRNLAGYARTPDGRRRVLVFLINDAHAEAAGPALDALVEWATESRGEALENFGKAAD
jgi:D-alanyl-D-alanine carboxypeptidase/D-alanyl-D-alanine-endopeptidase (penicillin-binding protein 4)